MGRNRGVRRIKKYEVKLTVNANDILDNWTSDDLIASLLEEVHYESYGQINIEHIEAKEVQE